MKQTRTAVAIAALALLAGWEPISGQSRKDDKADVEFQAAIHTEMVEGDLTGAIRQYKKVIADYEKSNRTVAAKALVQLGQCYEKSGLTESQKVYERVVREYADQKEAAAVARARLGHKGETDLVTRQVWSGEDVNLEGGPSPDGRLLTYVNWRTSGSLAVRDLVTGESRDLNKATRNSFAYSPVFVQEGKAILYTWENEATGRAELRMVSADGSNVRTIADREFYPASISRDGKVAGGYLYVEGVRQVAVMDLTTGKANALKSVGWRNPAVGNFSPDGRYLTYTMEVKQDSADREPYVIAVDGSSDTKLVDATGVNGRPIFTPDGSRVVLVSNRSGRWDLWAVRLAAGKLSGAPEIVKADVGGIELLGFTRDGSLYFGSLTRHTEARTIEFDPHMWRVKGEPKRVSERFVNINLTPAWSPDGKYLAYIRDYGVPGEVSYVVRDTASSDEREFKVNARGGSMFRWFPDNRSLLITQQGPQGTTFRRLNLSTGNMTLLFQTAPRNYSFWAAISADGRSVFYRRPGGLARRDIMTGEDTDVARTSDPSRTSSPDGYVARFGVCTTSKEQCVWAVPLSGGPERELRAPRGRMIAEIFSAWVPRNEGVLVTVANDPAMPEREIWYLPLDGGQPHNVGIPVKHIGRPTVHPSGTQLAFTEDGSTGQVSVMKNLFPEAAAAR